MKLKDSSNHAVANGCAPHALNQSWMDKRMIILFPFSPILVPSPLNTNMQLKKIVLLVNSAQKLLSGSCLNSYMQQLVAPQTAPKELFILEQGLFVKLFQLRPKCLRAIPVGVIRSESDKTGL